MVMGDTDLCPGTWDLRVDEHAIFGPPLREAAAEARAILLTLAAERLKLPESRLTVKDGMVSDKTNSRKRISYAELAQGKRIEKHLSAKPPLKKVSEFKVMGKPHRRTDSLEK